MLQKIQAIIYKWLWERVFSSFVVVIIAIATLISQYQHNLARRVHELPPLVILWTLAVFALLIFTLLTILFFKRLPLYWDPVIGTWNNRRNHLRNCGVCYSKGLVSPLKNETKGWSCVVCKQFYIDSTKSHTQTLPHTLVTTVRMRTQ